MPSNRDLDRMTPFDIIPGERQSPVLLHVPHCSTAIPDAVRGRLLLDDGELAAELAAMTDADTDVVSEAAARTARRCTPSAWERSTNAPPNSRYYVNQQHSSGRH